MGKRVGLVVLAAMVLLVVTGAWAAWTFRDAQQHLQVARTELEQARSALLEYDAASAGTSIAAAEEQASAAAELTDRWVWRGVAAVPKIGDSAEAARALVLAGDAAVRALAGITDSLDQLDVENIVQDKVVNLEAVAAAAQAAEASADPLAQARAYLANSPRAVTGGWVLPVIEEAAAELSTNIAELSATARAMQQAGELLPALLGGEGAKQYLIAIQAPNETRGTGGLLGTWAVASVDNGQISIIDSGANEDLPNLKRMPDDFGAGYADRYRDDPTLVPNMNMSPDYPVAAQLWLDSYEQKTGQRLDGVLSLDVNALGQLMSATGTSVQLPDGGTLDGGQFADFALRGIYDKFPDFSDTPARRDYQVALGEQATQALLSLQNPQAVLRTMVGLADQRRVALWVADPEIQTRLAETQLGHSLQPARPHSVEPVIINMGWSKLDSYIDRTFVYQVGRCPSRDGRVRSTVTTQLTSDIPPGSVLPPYVVGTVPQGPSGPINRVFLQTHLPPDSEVIDVRVDGESAQWLPFEEAGRPAAGVFLSLPPREPTVVEVVFDEPTNGAPAVVQVQPMARDAQVSVTERSC